MSKEKILLNLKDNDVDCSSDFDIDKENYTLIESIDNFIDSNFSYILAIGVPILILDFLMILFWMLIFYS